MPTLVIHFTGPRSTIFSITVHHGGVFTTETTKQYVGGKTDIMDGLDSDLLYIHELDSIVHYLGYGPPIDFHFLLPGYSLETGLVRLKSDGDVRAMIESLFATKMAELYVEHIGGVNFVERQTNSVEVDTDGLLVDEEVACIEGDAGQTSDESTEDEVYSDGSYDMTDDDILFETFIDDEVEYRGVGECSKKSKENVEENNVMEEIVLSDDYFDSEDETAYSSSDDDNAKVKEYQFKKFRSEHHMEDPPFELGMKFSSATALKDAVKQHAIKHRRNVKLVKNDKLRVRARCQKGCPWEIYARKVLAEESYQIRTYTGIHNCGISFTNRNINSSLIAKKYMADLRSNPSMPITAFKERVRKELKVDVSRSQLYRAKRKAAKLIYGDDIAQYGRLWDYCEELRRSNPGSTVVMDAPLDEEIGQPRFNRLYICLNACKSGFLHGWLDLRITPNNEHEFTFINDRQKGLQAALDDVFPRAEHRHCCKHLLSNFMKRYKGLALEEKFWRCVKASNVPQFEHAMECMKEENAEAYEYLAAEPARYWSRSHFKEIVKCDMVCNNMCEAFNKAILEAREKSIIEMLE
ncbi:hypothetical protein Vadar_025501 [Vaccinium darrowii]|uniref:Uncharacterized protein n=1 Tax=Vaccinium darrowii TaxID=229202 RepID=A0ACB7Y2F3_9ERIC|nr:hypothetical protein Vadar_025501 [Vaccinium darrowii]